MIALLRTGDGGALAETYRQFAAPLLATAFYLLGSRADAEDVVHDLFVGLPERLEAYEERGQFWPWLRRCAVRLALMRLRAGRRRMDLAIAGSTPWADTASEGPALERALERLPADERAVVVLKVIEGYAHQEIAELLGIRRNTSEVRLHRAIKRLREQLGDQ
jgi:RNA polymerase sigma-70 factor (ECF subfamily)